MKVNAYKEDLSIRYIIVTEEQVKEMSCSDIVKLMEKNKSYYINRNPDGSIHNIIDRSMKGNKK